MSIKKILKNPIRECGLGAKRANKENPVLCSMRSKIKCGFTGMKINAMDICPTTVYMLDYEGHGGLLMKWTENSYTNDDIKPF